MEANEILLGNIDGQIVSKTGQCVSCKPREAKFLKHLIANLYAEPGFSDVGIEDIAKTANFTINEAKCILGSLCVKGVTYVEDGDFADIIFLHTYWYNLHPEWC